MSDGDSNQESPPAIVSQDVDQKTQWPRMIWVLLCAQLGLSSAFLIGLAWVAVEETQGTSSNWEPDRRCVVGLIVGLFSLASAIFSLSATNLSMREIMLPNSVSLLVWTWTAASFLQHLSVDSSTVVPHIRTYQTTPEQRSNGLFALCAGLLSLASAFKLCIAARVRRKAIHSVACRRTRFRLKTCKFNVSETAVLDLEANLSQT